MGTTIRDTKLPIIDTLLKYPKKFSFEMASYILGYGSSTPFGKEMDVRTSPFRTQSLNVFHLRGTEIEKIKEVDGIKVIYVERLSIMGLNGPLPTPYCELIFRRTLEQDLAMSSFVNAFNMRLLGISYRISQRKFLNLQDHKKNCRLVKVLASLAGEPPSTMPRQFSRLSYLFWTKEKSVVGLKAIINYVLDLSVDISEFQTMWVKRNNVQHLGEMRLGKNFELGTKVSTCEFGIKITITHDDCKKIHNLITNQNSIDELKKLIDKYLGQFIEYKIFVTPKKVPSPKIGECSLGKNTWLPGENLDPIKIV